MVFFFTSDILSVQNKGTYVDSLGILVMVVFGSGCIQWTLSLGADHKHLFQNIIIISNTSIKICFKTMLARIWEIELNCTLCASHGGCLDSLENLARQSSLLKFDDGRELASLHYLEKILSCKFMSLKDHCVCRLPAFYFGCLYPRSRHENLIAT